MQQNMVPETRREPLDQPDGKQQKADRIHHMRRDNGGEKANEGDDSYNAQQERDLKHTRSSRCAYCHDHFIAHDVRRMDDFGGQIEPIAGREDDLVMPDGHPHAPAHDPANLGFGMGMVAKALARNHVKARGEEPLLFKARADFIDRDLARIAGPMRDGKPIHVR